MTVLLYTHRYYAVTKFPFYSQVSKETADYEARIQCLNCLEQDIPGHANYCPNCGIKFHKGGVDERDNQRT